MFLKFHKVRTNVTIRIPQNFWEEHSASHCLLWFPVSISLAILLVLISCVYTPFWNYCIHFHDFSLPLSWRFPTLDLLQPLARRPPDLDSLCYRKLDMTKTELIISSPPSKSTFLRMFLASGNVPTFLSMLKPETWEWQWTPLLSLTPHIKSDHRFSWSHLLSNSPSSLGCSSRLPHRLQRDQHNSLLTDIPARDHIPNISHTAAKVIF